MDNARNNLLLFRPRKTSTLRQEANVNEPGEIEVDSDFDSQAEGAD